MFFAFFFSNIIPRILRNVGANERERFFREWFSGILEKSRGIFLRNFAQAIQSWNLQTPEFWHFEKYFGG